MNDCEERFFNCMCIFQVKSSIFVLSVFVLLCICVHVFVLSVFEFEKVRDDHQAAPQVKEVWSTAGDICTAAAAASTSLFSSLSLLLLLLSSMTVLTQL